jgi:serine/threonine protein kinase
MSVVFRAIRQSDNRDVAIKYLKSDFREIPSMRARFSRECQLTRTFDHPNIIQVFETGEHNDSAYMVMEYLPIGGMDTMAGHPDFHPGVAIAAMRQTARALAYLHQRQVIHRDVKLSNVMVSRWEMNRAVQAGQWITIQLSDFGLSKQLPGDGLTQVGTRMGTEFYTAPEMRESPQNADHRADIYSLGVAIYRLLSRTGYPEGAYPPLHQLNPALPPEIDRLIDACLQVDRDRRLNNAADVDDALAVIERQMQ